MSCDVRMPLPSACLPFTVSHSHGVVGAIGLGGGYGGGEEAAAERTAGLGPEPGVDAVRVEAVAARREHLHLLAGHQRADADGAQRLRRLVVVVVGLGLGLGLGLLPGDGEARR